MTGPEHSIQSPAPRPCESCPYRRDVPSGIWAEEEYSKLIEYDRETFDQPHGLFQCHQNGHGDPRARLCAGWVAVHGDRLLALRIAAATNRIAPEVLEYSTDVPLWPTGAAAAEHGMAEIDAPGPDAFRVMGKIGQKRDVRPRHRVR